MRIWSIHPKYLDSKGLVALWRETLLAYTVVGTDKGYANHSQLERFKQSYDARKYLASYLIEVYKEAVYARGFNFNISKIGVYDNHMPTIPVTKGQVEYELARLKDKLAIRAPHLLDKLPKTVDNSIVHPIFQLVDGPIETWEKVK